MGSRLISMMSCQFSGCNSVGYLLYSLLPETKVQNVLIDDIMELKGKHMKKNYCCPVKLFEPL